MKIQVQVKTVYGQDLIYPTCETAKRLAKLARQKTLTPREISIIRDLGYDVEVVNPVLDLPNLNCR